MNRFPHLLPRVLASALVLAAGAGVSATAFAQDDATVVQQATMPKSRLVERYADLAGSTDAASRLVNQLRTGGDFTVTETVTTTVTNADGTTSTQTSTVDRTVPNAAGPMGWGEVNITLSLAQALVDGGKFAELQSALSGTAATTTNPDGTTTTATSGGVLAMRADGMGWGAIAKKLGFNLGTLMSASNRNATATAAAKAGKGTTTASAKTTTDHGKPAVTGKALASTKTDRVAAVTPPSRPEKVERPVRPEQVERPTRPERPTKPERGGRG
ncbi:hypothetical protein [Lysobacter xanthus]